MRSTRGFLRCAALLSLSLAAAAASAAEPAEEPAAAEPAAAQPSTAPQPTPRLAAAPASGGGAAAAGWQEGFMLLPSIGVNSFQGDGAQDVGMGLRLGLLAGSRMTELLSLNVGFAFDVANMDAPPGASASQYVLDIGFNPLLHFPLEKLEIIAGPLGGIFLDKGSISAGSSSIDSWGYGWTIGANAGLLFPVGSKIRLGGLINFYLRNPLKLCVTANGTDTCRSEGVDALKTLAVSFAAML